MGSWKIMLILFPRMSFMTLSPDPTSSCPSSFIDPLTILPVVANICIIEYAVTDFPDPDSPTMPSTLPLSRLNDMPFTARTSPASVKKDVCRSHTSNNAIISASLIVQLGIEGVAKTVSEKVQ